VPLCSLDAGAVVTRIATSFAAFSYTLYVVHFPFLAFLTCTFTHNVRVAPSSSGLVVFGALFAAAVAYAYVVSLIFERNTPVLQAWLMQSLSPLRIVRRPIKTALRAE